MGQKENQRVMLTKRLLKESLLRMMAEKNIRKISVSELCRDAGINRVTFYNHYGSQYDLLREIELETAEDLHGVLRREQAETVPLSRRVEIICTYLRTHSETVRPLFANNTAESEFAMEMFRNPGSWEKSCANLTEQYGEGGKELMITFLRNGAYSMIRQWVLTGMELSPREMGRIVSGITVKGYWE